MAISQAFSQQSIAALSEELNTFFAANPSITVLGFSNTVEGANFYAILLYTTST